jgi:hypothetical protein
MNDRNQLSQRIGEYSRKATRRGRCKKNTCSRSKGRNQISFRFGYLLQNLRSHLG